MSKDLEMARQQARESLALVDGESNMRDRMRTVDLNLALDIKRKLEKAPYQSTTAKREITIFPGRSLIGESNTNFYQPRRIAIGPYHRDCEDVKRMEAEKLRCVAKMLCENPDVTLLDYLEELRKLEPAARRCYNKNIEMNSDEFVEMLLYDTFIIIQLVVNWRLPGFLSVCGISRNIIPVIKSDLLLLENQIPFFVLQRVFDLYTNSKDNTLTIGNSTSEVTKLDKQSLVYLLVDFLMHESETLSVPEGDNSYGHLLHFYYLCYIRTQKFPTKPMKKPPLLFSNFESLPWRKCLQMIIATSRLRRIPNAAKLQEEGITLKKAKEKGIFGVHFSHGVLNIPSISVAEETMPQIVNLIAYEQFNGQQYKPFTSYVVFMDCIVKIPRDVQMLEQNGIIENNLGHEKEIIEFFKQLMCSPYLDNEDHHLDELSINMKNYCNSPWQKYKAKLLRDYFSNPWSMIPIATGGVLLLLTFVQTLYAVVSYYRA